MKIYITLIFLFILKVSYSQSLYFDEVTTVSKKTYTYKEIEEAKLKLDFYKPENLKKETPLILFVHGGGFSGGSRNNNRIKTFANFMAKRGYAVASITYRLIMKNKGFGCGTKSEYKINAFDTASEDISYAIKYLLENKKKFNINDTKIILAGSSAGAEAILNLAYVYDNKILAKKFKFAGLISMAGAVVSVDKINKKTAIPTQFFHGTDDKLVPYNIAPHHYCNTDDLGYLMLYGSRAIADKLDTLNKPYYIFSVKNGNHGWAGIPMTECTEQILDFLYYDVLKNQKRQIDFTM